MLEQLNEWLIGYTTLEMADIISSGFEALDELNVSGVFDELAMLWQQRDNYLYNDLLTEVQNLLSAGLFEVMTSRGIFLDATTSLHLLVQSVEALIWVGLTEEHDWVVRTLSEDVSPLCKVANLFAYANTTQPERWDNLILDVSDLLIEKIIEDHSNTLNIADEKVELDISKIMSYDLKYPDRLMRRALELGFSPKQFEIKDLLATFSEELIRYSPFDAKNAAIDLAGLVILSKIDDKVLAATSLSVAEDVFADIDFLRAVRTQLPQVLGEIKIYG